MTYEEAYDTYFDVIVKYCEDFGGLDHYHAETATSKAFDVLDKRWAELHFHDSRVIMSFLYQTARFTQKEVLSQIPPTHLSLDDPEVQAWVERTYSNDCEIDLDYENEKQQVYIRKIKKALSKKEYILFECLVLKKQSQEETAKKMGISKNAVKQRFARLKKRLKPILMEIMNVNIP